MEGLDEIDSDGRGMWQFVNGGQRYLLGEIPDGAPQTFEREGAVFVYLSSPVIGASLSYEPLESDSN
jgi:hypothetical protein